MKLHHHGIVVPDLTAAQVAYTSLGAELVDRLYDDPIQQARIAFLRLPGNPSLIELIEPYSPKALVASFAEKYGGGLHHTCYMAADLAAAAGLFRQSRAIPVFGPQPAVAFGGRPIQFFYLRDRSLVELVEAAPDTDPLHLLGGGASCSDTPT